MLWFLLCLARDHSQILILPFGLYGTHKRPLLVIIILVADLLSLLGFFLYRSLGPLTLTFLSPVILQVVIIIVMLLEIGLSEAESTILGCLIGVMPLEVTHHDLFHVGLQ